MTSVTENLKGCRCDFFLQILSDLPVKTLQTVLKRTFLMLYSSDYEGDDDNSPYQSGKSPSSQRRAYILLSSVCSYWHQTRSRWSSLPTAHWLKCHMEKLTRAYIHAHSQTFLLAVYLLTCFVINALARASNCAAFSHRIS